MTSVIQENQYSFRTDPPLILNFDHSVLAFARDEIRIFLEHWQEKIRFGCTWHAFSELEKTLTGLIPDKYGCVYTGSGDYHHLSLYLIKKLVQKRGFGPNALNVIVCDNHPDNMRYPFGVHCGSWIRSLCAMESIRRVHVVGITSADISARYAWQNYLTPFWYRKLTYWSIGTRPDWLRVINRSDHGMCFADEASLMDAFRPVLHESGPLYLSIDKDIFSPQYAKTNWDQGVFSLGGMHDLIRSCSGRIAGADITGDISKYTYKGLFKRFLSRLDGQEAYLSPRDVLAAQEGHRALNLMLLKEIENGWIKGES